MQLLQQKPELVLVQQRKRLPWQKQQRLPEQKQKPCLCCRVLYMRSEPERERLQSPMIFSFVFLQKKQLIVTGNHY